MDVLTEATLRVKASTKTWQWLLRAAPLTYGIVVLGTAMHHEPWADEAQSWLLARDASLVDLWSRLLHYEGTTGLWQTLLHILIRSGLQYQGINLLSGCFGLAAACVLFWRAPFPLVIRLALPFTFFLCYQYAVIARSYSLVPLLLFWCAATYDRVSERPILFTLPLCLLAAVSVHGMILALALGASMLVRSPNRSRLALPASCFAVITGLLIFAARPAHDGTFIAGPNLSFDHMMEVSAKALATAFTGEWMTSLAIIAISVPLLWRGGGWLFFLLAGVSLCGIASVVYSQVWHHGLLLLAWVAALWISWPRAGQVADRISRPLALAALSVVAVVQVYWSASSIAYDWHHAYSGSLEAARSLGERELKAQRVFAIGFACVAIEPYFPHNIFANLNEGRPEAYWDWSRRNHVNQDSLHLAESRPDYVLVGYKNDFERGVWTELVRKSGYHVRRHFEGNTYWQTRILEPESYDLYERGGEP